MSMPYRRLGRAGVKVSALSLGSWITFGKQIDEHAAKQCMYTAYDAGVNFFDNAEFYDVGQAETIMGKVLKQAGWRRSSYLVSTKFFWGLNEGPNEKNTLNRKYLLQAIDGSLKRLQMEYVDIVYCHRADPETPIEETVWAMHDIINRGKALYWGTSEWSAAQIAEAYAVADRHHLHKPQVEQPEYNMLKRDRVEREYAFLYEHHGMGLTTWSPLASGLLTGKYNTGFPPGARLSMKGHGWLRDYVISPERVAVVRRLQPIADAMGCRMSQLAIAWCLKNPNVSTVITGATNVEQVQENLKAIEVADHLKKDLMEAIEDILKDRPPERSLA